MTASFVKGCSSILLTFLKPNSRVLVFNQCLFVFYSDEIKMELKYSVLKSNVCVCVLFQDCETKVLRERLT